MILVTFKPFISCKVAHVQQELIVRCIPSNTDWLPRQPYLEQQVTIPLNTLS